MKPLAEPTATLLAATRALVHPHCFVCDPANRTGLGLDCTVMPDGSVTAEFTAAPFLEGYVGRLHGGVIAALLDGAMTNCLFALGYQAFTAELTIRYRHPVAVTQPLLVRAWRTDSRGPLHLLRAELRQNGKLSVTAIGKFMQFDE